MPTTKPILITGATGNQGGAVLSHLASHPSSPQFTLLAVTRNPTSPSALALQKKHPTIHLVRGDLNAIPALFSTAKSLLTTSSLPPKIWGVYSVQISQGPGASPATEVAQGTALIDESIKEGVQHFVYSSVDRGGNAKSFDTETPVPHFQSKFQIERHLREKAGAKGEVMGWTILRPVAFMDNLNTGFTTKVFLAALRDAMGGKALQWVSVEDIGAVAARAFRETERWNARAEGLAGDELTFEELSACFERVTGGPAPVTWGVLGSALMWGVAEVRVMVTWFRTDGYGVEIEKLREEEPGLCGFERWLRERSAWAKQGN
ncbi:NmrA family protein-like protein [Polyplosphaeria fusca]|uniref:NmrA family protein-like protein n=1 Tax=Polyplosphaeria fusca TaxID=682080 RepID=A0A9P4QXQ7_9PLEO|nr:NmrA family protein-like protein [Polyplosphaeria fusca]